MVTCFVFTALGGGARAQPHAQGGDCAALLAALNGQGPLPTQPSEGCAARLASDEGQAALARCASDPACMARLDAWLTPPPPAQPTPQAWLSAQACDAITQAITESQGQCAQMAQRLDAALEVWSHTQDPKTHPGASEACTRSLGSYALTSALLDCLSYPAVRRALEKL